MTPATHNIIRFFAAAILIAAIIIYGRWHLDQQRHNSRGYHYSCVNNLRQIGIAFRTWELDNHDRFPCNVSTNEGGALELCSPGTDGFDKNPALQFRTLSNELSTTLILVCPKDRTKTRAPNFSSLETANLTY